MRRCKKASRCVNTFVFATAIFLVASLTLPTCFAAVPSSLPTYIDEFDIPTQNSAPLAITADQKGIIWFTESNATKLGRFDPANKAFKEYVVPGVGDMWGVTVDHSGYVWLTQYSGKGSTSPGGSIVPGGHGRLLRFDPSTANFTIVDIPTPGSFPFRVIADKEGRVWFTELLGDKIGLYDPASKTLEEYAVPSPFSGPADLTFDGQGTLWFTEAYNESLGIFQPSTKTFGEYHLSTTDPSRFIASPVGIAVAQNGQVWFADHGGNWVAEFNPTSQSLKRYPTSAGSIGGYAATIAIPNGLLIDGQGRVWFSEHWGNRISYFDARTQTMVEFRIPTGPVSTALWIALTRNGDIWFTEWSSNKLGILHANLPVPFSVTVSEGSSQVAAGGAGSLSVSAMATQQVTGNGTFRYSWSSYQPNEVQVAFNPQTFPSFTALAKTTTEVRISPLGSVSPGNYTLSVGLDAGTVLISRMVAVEVTEPSRGFVPQVPDIALLLAGILVFALVGLLLRKKLVPPALKEGRT